MQPSLSLLQICNVGQITGGTAACAWSVTRALPEMRHGVVMRTKPDEATLSAFADCEVWQRRTIDRNFITAFDPDLILLHNTPVESFDGGHFQVLSGIPTLLYLHSRVTPPAGIPTVCCSHWLARQARRDTSQVLHQAVPLAPGDQYRPVAGAHREAEAPANSPGTLRTSPSRRLSTGSLNIGRICTPRASKWPRELIPFYRALATEHPDVHWEFVGCPTELQPELGAACRHQADFHPASWEARSHLHRWDVLLYHHPTLTESFGRTAAEAMRVGCVPVVDARGGFVEQLPEGTGFPCQSLSEFSQALLDLRDVSELQRRRDACLSHANSHFSFHAFRQRLLTRFEELLKRKPLPVPS